MSDEYQDRTVGPRMDPARARRRRTGGIAAGVITTLAAAAALGLSRADVPHVSELWSRVGSQIETLANNRSDIRMPSNGSVQQSAQYLDAIANSIMADGIVSSYEGKQLDEARAYLKGNPEVFAKLTPQAQQLFSGRF